MRNVMAGRTRRVDGALVEAGCGCWDQVAIAEMGGCDSKQQFELVFVAGQLSAEGVKWKSGRVMRDGSGWLAGESSLAKRIGISR